MSTEPTGTLRVHVLTETRAPLAGCKCSYGEASEVTDAGGLALLVGPPGRSFLNVDPPAGEKREHVNGFQSVDAGQIVDVTVTLSLRLDMVFCCRLVAAADQRPIAGANVRVLPGGVSATSDQAGVCSVVVDPGRAWLDITARGRAPIRLVPEGGHETPATAMLVPLERGADLALTVVDAASRTVSECGVDLRVFPWYVQWPRTGDSRGEMVVFHRDHPDDDGILRLTDLPASIALQVSLTLPPGVPSPSGLPPFVLSVGANTRRLVLEAPGTIAGHVLDADGRPLANVLVGHEPATDDSLPLMFVDRTEHPWRTAADGSFRSVLAPGAWIVGVDAGKPTSGVLPGLVIPCLRVVVSPGLVATAELRAQPQLIISGRAIGPDDTPVPGLAISAERDGQLASGTRTAADGTFRIEQLRAGRHQLTTEPYEDRLGLAAPVSVDAGEQDITLHLVAAFGTVRGRVVEADSGAPTHAWVFARQRDGDDAIGMGCDLDGRFVYRGLRPGIWDLVASDTRGRCGFLAGLQIVAGGEQDHLQLALQPGALLRPRHPDADEFVVVRGGDVIARDNLPDGTPGEARVLPGLWTVRFLRKDREIARRDVTVRAGDDVLVDGR